MPRGPGRAGRRDRCRQDGSRSSEVTATAEPVADPAVQAWGLDVSPPWRPKMIRKMLLAATALAALTGSTLAQSDYPAQVITTIVPFSAGGSTDTIGRLIAEPMTGKLGQQVIVENIGGAGGTLGAGRAARATPDGYTLLLHHIGLASSVGLYRKLPYDTATAFAPIGLVTDVPMTIVARADFPANSVGELLAYIRANKDQVVFAHAGVGSVSAPLRPAPDAGTGHEDDLGRLQGQRAGDDRACSAARWT